ncbi:MAG TPA: hypothetical protein VFO35_02240, partial [Steroidobacteraceae bacterium]|nr:hypothetical protein [Steroidobacteraceae bacterium]
MRRAAKWAGLTLGALLILVLAVAAWGVNTQSGARSIANLAVDFLGGKLALGSIDGKISGPLTLADLRYRDPEAGIDARLQRVRVDLELRDLFRTRVHVRELQANGVDVTLSEPTKPPEPQKPFSLQPPIDIQVDSFALDSARIRRDEALLVEITRAVFSGRWTSRDLTVKQLDVSSPQGEIKFAGRVREREIYTGDGHGTFRWTVGERSFAGVLDTRTQGSEATLTLKMQTPLDLELQAEVTQSAEWPWRFKLEAPRFDPREELLPTSSLTSLAASLSGHGSAEQGAISGKVVINDEPLLIEPLRFMRKGDSVSIDTILRISRETDGAIHIGGDVDLAREPVSAKVAAKWHEVIVPVAWVGQELHTRGNINLEGSSESYAARGTLSLGPPERIADVALNVKGTPQRVELQQFDISQQAGRLAARGRIDLQPQLAWDVTAVAKDFDPGAFAAG